MEIQREEWSPSKLTDLTREPLVKFKAEREEDFAGEP